MVGRRGLEPRTSALDRAERCASKSERPSGSHGVMWSNEQSGGRRPDEAVRRTRPSISASE